LLDRARLFTLAQQPLLALDDGERAMKIEPESMRARLQTGEALLDAKRPDDVGKLRVSQNLARDRDGHVAEKAWRELGEQDASILQNPGKAEPLAIRSKILRGLNQFTLALADAQAALAINDKLGLAHFEAAQSLKELGQSKEALGHAIAATELNPSDAAGWFYRGLLEEERADFSAAIASHTKSLSRRESLPALREREKCARRVGQIDSANADLTRIRELESGKQ
jgi:tetratricopeptide (TPR) repeat protein